ncbi:MAG: YbaB/EbfC family nucleoid-associated protein [Clostridia bacterium]|nr:YbaB/EbfC family nucleoid-associated protein [Clostridia bacterium]
MKVNLPKSGGANNMLLKVQKFQEDMAALQEELENREYDITAGGGAVKVRINGKREILSVSISPEIVDPDDTEMLSDIIVAAINEAIRRVDGDAKQETDRLTAESGLGGLGAGMGLPF